MYYHSYNPAGLIHSLNKKYGAKKAVEILFKHYPGVTCEEINEGLGYDYFKQRKIVK